MCRPRARNWFCASARVIFPVATSSCSDWAMPNSWSTAVRNWAIRSSRMRLWLSEADSAMIAQTVSADSATMLASLVRIFNRLSRFIATSGEQRFPKGIAGTFLPIMNGYHGDHSRGFYGIPEQDVLQLEGQNKNIENNPM